MLKVFCGIDLGGTTIDIGLVTEDGTIVSTRNIPSVVKNGVEDVLNRISETVHHAVDESEYEPVAVGIGIAGLVDSRKGILREATNLPGWVNVPLGERLREKLNLPVVVDNDANVAALGEYAFGAGQGYPFMMMVTLGTGVGAGLILDGRIYHGAYQAAGEFGHTTIDKNGPICGCGSPGCVEAYIGTAGILRTTKELLMDYPDSQLAEIGLNGMTPKDIWQKAKNGDKLACRVFNESGQALGYGLGSVVNLLNLQRIVLGGGVAAARDFIIKSAQKTLDNFCLNNSDEPVQIVPAKLGHQAGIVGAASLAMSID